MLGSSRGLLPLALLVAALVHAACPSESTAHDGPPFPLFMDKPLGELRVSVWADPDIGDAQFYIVLESPEGSAPQVEPRVTIWTEPTSGRLARETYPALRQSLRNRMQFQAQPYFDQQDHWSIGIRVTDSRGQPQELLTEVESTPPGFGPWDIAIYLFPFVLLGTLWGIAMFRRRAAMNRMSPDHAADTHSSRLAPQPDSPTVTGGAR